MSADDSILNPLIANDFRVLELYQAIRTGGGALLYLPDQLRVVLENECWRHRRIRHSGKEVHFDSFVAFVEAKVPDGLEADIPTLRRLVAERPDVLLLLDKATRGEHGGDRKSGEAKIKADNISLDTVHPDGTSAAYALRRLERAGEDGLLQQVMAKEISPNAAMVRAGLRPKTFTVVADPKRAARTLAARFGIQELEEIMSELRALLAGK